MTHPAVRDLLHSLARHPGFEEVVRRYLHTPSASIELNGLTLTAKALYLVHLWLATGRQLLVVVDGNQQAELLYDPLQTFFEMLAPEGEPPPLMLPAFDVLPHQALSPHNEISEQRAVGLWRQASQRVPIVIAPAASALFRVGEADAYRQLALHLKVEDEVPIETLVQHLQSIGYEPREPVEMVGEYSVRGGIVDIFPPEAGRPIRIEFFGDTIDSLRRFDIATQRSVAKVDSVLVLPLTEFPRPAEIAQQRAGWEFRQAFESPRTKTLFHLLAKPLIVWDEPEQTKGAAERYAKRLAEDLELAEANFFQWGEFHGQAEGLPQLTLRELGLGSGEDAISIATRPALTFRGNVTQAISEARSFSFDGGRSLFFAPASGEVERLADIFKQYELPYQFGIVNDETTPAMLADRAYQGEMASTYLVKGAIRRGVTFMDDRLAVYGIDDVFDSSGLPAAPQIRTNLGAFAMDVADLRPGDFVVHVTHGVGKFVGVREIRQGDQPGDFMLLEYAGEAKLYVPLTRLDLISKYRGAGDSPPPLDRMGGVTWTKTKARVKARMVDMADELLKLYAARKMAGGFSFSADSNWQREFEDSFEYNATKDQLNAVRDIKRDMEGEQPMDRLLCGDVGFGKTEVAMRAAFKALGDGKQVALLAPTTVLAFQHFESFKRRFAAFPARIEHLSRFRSAKETKAVLEDLEAGKIDIVIGTQRILSKDVKFADLGLLIVDEEQRFGVRHKEALKQIRHNVDVLAMSATPIPRTLHMSLLGIRDMSVIETPPKDRLAIHTVVAHFDLQRVKEGIEQELSRGGQVYYIHNRVDSIFIRAASIQQLLPNCRIGVGHGQMGDAELERVLLGFMKHDYDVFVCTTIAENGLDIPLANTIFIENAERYGLSELYQLRGRVGRSNRRAYAHLLVPADTELTEVARKRLAALKEFSDLGAGFKIAALDLELRGAGNLLGGEQHGQIAAVGFETYLRLLEESVQELKGEEVPLEIHSTLNLGIDVRIPSDYITDENQRLRAYKKIADVKDAAVGEKLIAELADRYGPPPAGLTILVEFALLKSLAQKSGVEAIDRRHGFFNIKLHERAAIEPMRLMEYVRNTPQAQFTPAGVLSIVAPAFSQPGELLAYLKRQLEAIR
ncbi:MAG: transcription-repair coupling factor [Bryobacteraceae bacterium]|nr:transcription-repair coupling factor [Bryobacteraceae bacterium]